MITIQELLRNRGLDVNGRVKLVRHKDSRLDLYTLYRTNRVAFLKYQNKQAHSVFSSVDYIVSFIGEEGRASRFVGVFRILGCTFYDDYYWYEMEELEGFEDMKERVIVKWKNARMWHQWAEKDTEIIEICPGLGYKRFTDYFDLILTYSELKDIIEKQYKDWRQLLSAVKGVYLITDTKTGKLYIGSAYGEDGLWGRWTTYISTGGHGGNKLLRELVEETSDYAYNFNFSILKILPKTITAEMAIEEENLFKTKLGTNAFGLNKN